MRTFARLWNMACRRQRDGNGSGSIGYVAHRQSQHEGQIDHREMTKPLQEVLFFPAMRPDEQRAAAALRGTLGPTDGE